MKKYELLVVFKPNADSEEIDKLLEKVSSDIEALEGKTESVEKIGRKKLAYEIQKMSEAYYYFVSFDAEADVPAQVEANVRIMEPVIRYLCVRQDA